MIEIKRTSKLPAFFGGFNVGNAINQGHEKAGILIKRELVRGLTTGSRNGRVYVIRGKSHQASAAGEYPAKLSGKLAASVGYKVANKRLTIGESADYAAYLELGTSKMAARPHLRPSVDRNIKAVQKLVEQEVGKVFK